MTTLQVFFVKYSKCWLLREPSRIKFFCKQLPSLCHIFLTSKINQYGDLSRIRVRHRGKGLAWSSNEESSDIIAIFECRRGWTNIFLKICIYRTDLENTRYFCSKIAIQRTNFKKSWINVKTLVWLHYFHSSNSIDAQFLVNWNWMQLRRLSETICASWRGNLHPVYLSWTKVEHSAEWGRHA